VCGAHCGGDLARKDTLFTPGPYDPEFFFFFFFFFFFIADIS
jgi:hypothetical protein